MDAAESNLTETPAGRPAYLRGWHPWAIAGGVLLLGWFLFFRGGKKDLAANPAGRPVPVVGRMTKPGNSLRQADLLGIGAHESLES